MSTLHPSMQRLYAFVGKLDLEEPITTQSELAFALRQSPQTVKNWESRGISKQGALTAQQTFGVNPVWLLDGSSEDSVPVQRSRMPAYAIKAIDGEEIDQAVHTLIDEVDIMLAAGSGALIPEYVETKFRMAYRLDWFQRERINPKNCKLMRVSGRSMESLLFDGDRVLINLADTRVRDGKVYVIAIGWEAKVKRLFNMRDGSLRIVSDNPDKDTYPDETVPQDEMDTVAIIGRAVDKSGRGGL